MNAVVGFALDSQIAIWFGIGLGVAFLVSLLCLFAFMRWLRIDVGFLGLMFLLTLIFFLIAFSFLVAAAVRGMDIKIAIAIVDALVLLGIKRLTPSFLNYLED